MNILRFLLLFVVLMQWNWSIADEGTSDYLPGQLIIAFNQGHGELANPNLYDGLQLLDHVITSFGEFQLIKIPDWGENFGESYFIDILKSDPAVDFVEHNFLYHTQSDFIANKLAQVTSVAKPQDPHFTSQWGHHDERNEHHVDALKAWEVSKGDKSLVVAVIDSGIDYNHPDLKANMWVNEAEKNGRKGRDSDGNGYVDDIHGYNFVDNKGSPMDDNDHGTHCAGVIGAVHNEIGISGVMADVKLMALKFLGRFGSGATMDAVKAIDYAVKMKADILNNSWGGGGFSRSVQRAIQAAHRQGIVFVAAAGNNRSDNDRRNTYPANYEVPNVISVANHQRTGRLASSSNYGKTSVHISAPGSNIYSTVAGGRYRNMTGTSMAAPYVSGAIGLLLSVDSTLNIDDIRKLVMESGQVSNHLKGKVASDAQLNAYNLVSGNRGGVPGENDPPQETPTEWKRYGLPQAVETPHNYHYNMNETYTVSVPNAQRIKIIFDRFETERGYDFLRIYDSNGTLQETLSGRLRRGLEVGPIQGDSARLVFTSDRYVNLWGFRITEVLYQ